MDGDAVLRMPSTAKLAIVCLLAACFVAGLGLGSMLGMSRTSSSTAPISSDVGRQW